MPSFRTFSVLFTTAFLILSTPVSQAQVPPWFFGDETTVCFTSPADRTQPGTPLDIRGLTVRFTLPKTLTAGQPPDEDPTITASFSPEFWTSNNALLVPAPNGTDFQQLCGNQTSPPNPANCKIQPAAAINCCLWHIQFHACRKGQDTGDNFRYCQPWASKNDTTTRSEDVIFTATSSLFGFPGDVTKFPNWTIPNANDWTVIAHIRIGNAQCASGRSLTVNRALTSPSPSPSTSASSSSDSTALPMYAIIVIAVLGTLIIIAAAFTAYRFRRRSDKYHHSEYRATPTGSGRPGSPGSTLEASVEQAVHTAVQNALASNRPFSQQYNPLLGPPTDSTRISTVPSIHSTAGGGAGAASVISSDWMNAQFVVNAPFPPPGMATSGDELKCNVGDVVMLESLFSDRWAKGINQTTGEKGTVFVDFLTEKVVPNDGMGGSGVGTPNY
ncbi:hypothetical protein HK104_011241 [Borealophlyctis nickersoniae]|nr:hypothetical protein HK104_011241 [Borealophlyctis nickersoniae]